jgi:hypothetical protein
VIDVAHEWGLEDMRGVGNLQITRWQNRIKNALHMEGAKRDSRSLVGEIETTIADLTLPGKPFPMRTADHPIRQRRFPRLEWP